jgi:hypothetical protein
LGLDCAVHFLSNPRSAPIGPPTSGGTCMAFDRQEDFD